MTDASFTSIDLSALVRDATGEWTLDPTASSVEFHVKHFWGVITVHGHFDTVTGRGRVDPDGAISGQIQVAANSLNTKNKQRDKHLRSEDFFDAERHPTITISASRLSLSDAGELYGPITLDAAGHQQAFDAVVHVVSAAVDAITVRAEAIVDRTTFGMTWSPLKMAAPDARVVVTARFVRN
jgi:polyisoprenoid-binding protein YceI